MKFLVDAQLPKSLAQMLSRLGFDAVHTLELPNGNLTRDYEIAKIADDEQRVVVTKDEDFIESHLLIKKPARILIISTGNIKNAELLILVKKSISKIVDEFMKSDFIELSKDALIVHEKSF